MFYSLSTLNHYSNSQWLTPLAIPINKVYLTKNNAYYLLSFVPIQPYVRIHHDIVKDDKLLVILSANYRLKYIRKRRNVTRASYRWR
jgi:hypothetical protein